MRPRVLKLLAATFVATALTVTGCQGETSAPAGPDDTSSYGLLTPGTLTIGSSLDYKPLEYIEDGQEKGFDLDLIRAIANRLNLKTKIVNTPFDTLVTQLASGSFDVVISGISDIAERRKVADFSKSYFTFKQVIAIKKNSTVASTDDLKGKTVGLQTGTLFEESAPRLFPDTKIQSFPDTEAIMTALRAGQIDGAFLDQVAVVAAGNDVKVGFSVENNPNPTSILVRKGHPELLAAINDSIDALIADGTYQRLYQQYMGDEPPAEFRAR